MKALKDISIGARVRYFTDPSGQITSHRTTNSCIATVLNRVRISNTMQNILLGWLPGEIALSGSKDIIYFGLYPKSLELASDRGQYVDDDFLVEETDIIILAPELNTYKYNPQGMICSRCRDFNPYGQANQPDGTFKCFGCRR